MPDTDIAPPAERSRIGLEAAVFSVRATGNTSAQRPLRFGCRRETRICGTSAPTRPRPQVWSPSSRAAPSVRGRPQWRTAARSGTSMGRRLRTRGRRMTLARAGNRPARPVAAPLSPRREHAATTATNERRHPAAHGGGGTRPTHTLTAERPSGRRHAGAEAPATSTNSIPQFEAAAARRRCRPRPAPGRDGRTSPLCRSCFASTTLKRERDERATSRVRRRIPPVQPTERAQSYRNTCTSSA